MKSNQPYWNRIAALGLAVFLTCPRLGVALPSAWTDLTNDNAWETGNNWLPTGVPNNNTFDVEIGLVSSVACNFSSAFQINSLALSTNTATLNLVPGALLAFTSNLANNGAILVNTTGANVTTKLRFDASVSITGSGNIRLNGFGNNFNVADLDTNGQTVTIGSGQTIHGRGTILSQAGILINNGTIAADDTTGSMQLDLTNNASFVNQNNATIKAINGALLGLYSGLVDQTGGGTFLADGTNSLVQLGGNGFAVVEGGILNTANNGVIAANSSGVGLVSCTNNGTFLIPSGNIAVISGSYGSFGPGTGLTNNGTITIGDGTNVATSKIRFDGTGTLGGSGSVLLKGFGNTFNVADLDTNGQTVTIGSGQTIHGRGTILSQAGILINNGTIAGDDPTGNLQLDLVNNASFINKNNATIKATNGGVLGLYSGLLDQTGGGTLLADGSNSIVQLGNQFAIVVGGTLNTTNNGIIQVTPGASGVGLTSVTNNGTFQIPGGEIVVVNGTGLTNNGTILVDTAADNATTKIRFDASGTLDGNGSLMLNGVLGSFNVADFDCNSFSVINGPNHTIKGNGDILMNGGSLTNNGIMAPGLSPGQLDYAGLLNLGSTSFLSFEIGGTTQSTQYDLLKKIDGAAQTLGGNLSVRLINNFIPLSNDTFTIVTTQAAIAGAFTNVASGGRLVTSEGTGSFRVTYSGTNVVLDNFQVGSAASQLIKLSTRAELKKNSKFVDGIFKITGPVAKKVLIRGLGPSLPVSQSLPDPTLTLRDSNGATIATNNNWKDTQQSQIQATGHAPSNDKESAILVTLSPGTYTASLTGPPRATFGLAQVEVFDVDTVATSRLVSISTLGLVGSGTGDWMVGDFTVGNVVTPQNSAESSATVGGGKVKVLIRVLGPSLGGRSALKDPTVELTNANGSSIFFNDNWQDSQKAQIQATGLAPTDAKESAIVVDLDPGSYFVTVRGKGRYQGFARVEIYEIQPQGN